MMAGFLRTRIEERRIAAWHRSLTVQLDPASDPMRAMGVMRPLAERKPAYCFDPKSPLLARPDGRGGFVDPEGVPVAVF